MMTKNMEFSAETMTALEKLVPELGTQDYAKATRDRIEEIKAETDPIMRKNPPGTLPKKSARTKAEDAKCRELLAEREALEASLPSLTRMGRASVANVVRELVREGLERRGIQAGAVDTYATGRTRKTHASAKGGA